MLIPRFSIRWLLIYTTSCALYALVISLAVVSHYPWAIAMSVAIAGLYFVFLLYSLMFLIAWGCTTLWRLMIHGKTATSPFAMHTPPPQLLRSEEPD